MCVERGDSSVWLTYSGGEAQLQQLVEAEQGCCGAAGVEFSLHTVDEGVQVHVRETRAGLPAKTVLAAFAGMAQSARNG